MEEPEQQQGIYDKYHVAKVDGTTDPDADYFVLRLDKDPHAREAAKAYAESIKAENLNLSMDIYAKVMKYEKRNTPADNTSGEVGDTTGKGEILPD